MSLTLTNGTRGETRGDSGGGELEVSERATFMCRLPHQEKCQIFRNNQLLRIQELFDEKSLSACVVHLYEVPSEGGVFFR